MQILTKVADFIQRPRAFQYVRVARDELYLATNHEEADVSVIGNKEGLNSF